MKSTFPRVAVNRILLKPNEVKERTVGLIIVKDSAGERAYEATVVAVGSSVPTQLDVGATVLALKGAGVPVMLEKGNHVVVKEDDILVIL